MAMRSEIKMHFTLTGHGVALDTITELVGIRPSETRREGERISKTIKMPMKCDLWRISSSLPLDAPFTDHVSAMLAIVHPYRHEIVGACERYSMYAELLGVIYSYEGDRPGVYFERDEVEKIAALGAAIDLDIYIFP